ncbi:MAG TPA: YfhO family protein [Thermoanaerobaculia bacterium]|jgi:uncharacterized membrane protein
MNERWAARAIVALVVIVNAAALAPELEIGRVNLNDTVFHFTILDRLVERPALEFWMPEWSFGYPVLRGYQPLGHWLAASAHFATFRQFPLDVLFAFLRWGLLAIFPLSAYLACRWLPMPPMTAAAVSLLAPLIASPNLYGIEYGSYIWRGNGLYTQLVAMHFFVLAIGAGCRAIRNGRAVWAAGLLLALTFLSHFIYGYMAALTLVLIAALPGDDAPARRRFTRLLWIAAMSIALTAFQLLPILTDGAFINRSRWEPLWKWNSFGAKDVLGLTLTGDLLDARRLPVLSFLALAGAIAAWRRRREFPAAFALAGAALWIFLFCGRASWGPLYKVLGLSDAAQLHRFIGGAQWFLLILAAWGLAWMWTRWRLFGAVALTALILWPAVAERRNFLREGEDWGRENLAAYETHRDALQQTIASARAHGGRAYPGLAASWGAQLRIGYVPFYAFLSEAHVPAVAFLYHAMALPADVMVRFDENRPDHYRLFDIRTVIAEAGRQLPPFLRESATHGPFRVLQAPPSGTFSLVQVPQSVYVDRRTFYDVNHAWLQSQWPAADAHLALDYEGALPQLTRTRLGDLATLAQPPPPAACGTVMRQSGSGESYRAEVDARGDCVALFKMTYHPNWRATVDGTARPTVMLSPGFIGVPLPAGRHTIDLRYEASFARPLLLMLALPFFLGAFFAERKGLLQRLEQRVETTRVPPGTTLPYALLVAALVLPVAAPFLGSAQPNGHDALQYLPRVTEFHENIRHGILLPRWAPNLGSGQGQPLFLLNPPLFYYLTEAFHLVGLPLVTAMNAACVLLIFAAAASMFLLARWYFGAAGGALAAIAYVYAPYFLVDLYVRTAFSEFAAFPFYPLVLYGFARHAESRDRRYLVLGAVAYAALWFAHTPAALLFSPLLGAFLLFLAWRARSGTMLASHVAVAALGMLLAAAVWMPSVVEAQHAHTERLREGPLRYSNHYVAPAQFFSSAWGYGPSVPGDQDGMPFSLGWPHLAVAALAAVAVARAGAQQWKEWIAFFGVATFVLCFLMTERSHQLWDAIPQLQYVAFPWRLLAPACFCLALLTAAIVLALPRLDARWQRLAYAAIIAVLVLTALPHATPPSYLSYDPQLWTPRQLAARGAVAGTFETFEPRSVTERPTYNGGAITVERGTCTPAVQSRRPTSLTATVHATTDCTLELPIASFPGWQISIGGSDWPLDPPAATGRMRVTVSPGNHRLEAEFVRTPIRWAADITSVAALLIGVALARFARVRRS